MNRLDHDVCMAAAQAITEMVAPLLREEEIREFFNLAFGTLEAMLIKRDELLKRERQRLGRPSDN
ncbi:hypothetical protein R5W24_000559 [Gemmata sp. JC717]|uniref:hypothetical protein n=1 Tax=Gemmata algarum TaxID=2975278 RepID=UPI0021BAE687|nr:hypothetical protein [Gemmata algarum]MDY3551483.1 hypothetical protein [Gemmata algarum]